MNKIILAFLFLTTATFAQAQSNKINTYPTFSKGDKMVGTSIGSFLFNSGSSEVSFPQVRGYSSHSTGFAISFEPAVGFFVSDKTVIGGTIIVKTSSQKIRYEDLGTTFQEDQQSNFNIGAGFFARNYFGTASSWRPFAQAGFNAGISSASSEGFKYYDASPDYKVSYDGNSPGGFFANAILQAGVSKMMGVNTVLDFYIGYNY